jgi:sugar porter (SP) family MFS transporter
MKMLSSRTAATEADSSSLSLSSSRSSSTRNEGTPLEINLLGLLLVVLPPMLGGFLYGFDIGATSFVLVMLLHPPPADSLGRTVWWTDLSSARQGLIVSGLSLGALIGSHIVLIYLSQRIGRRMELRLCSVFYFVGALLNVMSGTVLKEWSTIGFLSLCLGRVLYGIGVGFVMHGAPAYLAEMSPTSIRGAIVSAKETVIVGGIVVGYMVGNGMSADPLGWTHLYGVCGIMALPMFAVTYYIPRSKRWLLMQGLDQEAFESMQFIHNGDIKKEYETLVESVSAGSRSPSVTKNTREPSVLDLRYRKAVLASMGLIIFQQFSGQPSVLSYATVLFQAAGWSGNASVVSSILMMVTSAITVMLVERVGRKFLLCTGCLVMMIALSALSVSFWDWDDEVDHDTDESGSAHNFVILCAMFVYIAGYQIGFGPITWCIVSETFPMEIRGKAIALGVEMNYALNFGVQFIFPTLQEKLGWGRTFCLFGIVLAFSFFYIRSYVPETTGLSLEEIQMKLSGEDGFGDSNKDKQHTFLEFECPTEETSLLVRSASFLGAHPNLEEMESQLIRTSSGQAFDKIRSAIV